ncbi:MAG: thiamine diphosphokinase [Ruminococcaceae bacterium]|nr:thiamine diphosphokinase [Oscillospiraceae bacterium]
MSSKTALVFTGGMCNLERIRSTLPTDPWMILAADSGYHKAAALGMKPHKLVGDFDSLFDGREDGKLPEDVEIYKSPCEKDETDTMLACEIAVEAGAEEIIIIGGTGGRADHGLSNILYLENLDRRGIRALLTDGENRIQVRHDCTVKLADRKGYFSVFALDSCTVTLTGCKYPLTEAKLERAMPYAVSNEVAGEEACIALTGYAVIMESIK